MLRALGFLIKWSAVVGVWLFVIGLGITAWYATDLPDIDDALKASRRPTVTLLAADGSVLATRGDVYGAAVTVEGVPKSLPQAVLATEDRRFYSHYGLDPIGLARAMYANIKARRIVQGGSTITQQAAKNLFLSPARTFKRKVQEVLLALWLEHKFTKDQILTIYLNRVYLGAGTYGVDAAARRYFRRPAAKLNTYQSAMLAGLLKAPSRYNPMADPKRAHARTTVVLNNMVAAGYLSENQAAQAKKQRTRGTSASAGRQGRYFVDWVFDQVSDYVTPGDRDIVVDTTLDPALQGLAEHHAARRLTSSGKQSKATQVALVALAPDGAVKAMVGGRDYATSQFNRAALARRQPGSAFKPVVYLAGLEAGLTPTSRLNDAPIDIGGWKPRNFDGKYRGPISMAESLAGSVNSVAVRVARRAGYKRVVETAERLGISSRLQATPSLALGAGDVTLLELTAAFVPFANGGAGVWPHGITGIRDGGGKVLYRRQGSGPGRVASAQHVGQMNRMMAGVLASGTGRAARLARPAAGKTGTSQNFRDAWFVGHTAHLVSGVWIGNDDGKPMNKVTGGGLPARLWKDFMTAAHKGVPARALPGVDRAPTPSSAPRAVPLAAAKPLPTVPEPSLWEKLKTELGLDAN